MSFVCNLCNNIFTQKGNLMRHLKEKRCKTGLIYDLVKLNNILKDVKIELLNINTNVEINTINELNIDYLEIKEMRKLIDIYDTNENILNSLLSEYIKNIICNEKHPENHCIKYVDKKMKIFSFYIIENGIKIHIKDNYKYLCNITSEYFYKIIKNQFSKFLEFYKDDIHLYKDTIIKFKKELNINNISKALKTCLHAYILNDKNMKI
jgi:hypothetical protein